MRKAMVAGEQALQAGRAGPHLAKDDDWRLNRPFEDFRMLAPKFCGVYSRPQGHDDLAMGHSSSEWVQLRFLDQTVGKDPERDPPFKIRSEGVDRPPFQSRNLHRLTVQARFVQNPGAPGSLERLVKPADVGQVAQVQLLRVSARIASSRPSIVSGNIRSCISWRTI